MESSHLYRLSPELRNRIYETAFLSPYAITLQTGHIQHPLTRTCRQIRHETLSMYFNLTRFNAHLDDGPATPLANWLKTCGKELVACVDKINIWDMHMLNGTLHGADSTTALLSRGTEDGKPYILKPIGNWVFNRGWYLKDIILALHTLGLGLSRFCILDTNAVEGSRLKLTSEFAIVELASKAPGEVLRDEYTEIEDLTRQFGLSDKAREQLILELASGQRIIRLQERHRKLVFEFEADGRRLKTMRQEFTSEVPADDVDWSALGDIDADRD